MRLLVRVLATLIWVVALIWLIQEPKPEPLITLLGATTAFFGSLLKKEASDEGRLHRWQWPSWGYEKRYRQYIIDRHQYFDVKGLNFQGPFNLALSQIFVELSLDSQSPHDAEAAVIPVELRHGRHTIWALLQAKQMASHSLVIIGVPGSGKTTLLKYISLVLAGNRRRRQQLGVPDKLPMLLFLRDHARAIATEAQSANRASNHTKGLGGLSQLLIDRLSDTDLRQLCLALTVNYEGLPVGGTREKIIELLTYLNNRNRLAELLETGQKLRPDILWKEFENAATSNEAVAALSRYSLVDAIEDSLLRWGPPPPTGWLERKLSRGQCLILLDGLDEIADPQQRQAVVTWVERQMIQYSSNRFILSSRPFGYRDNPLERVAVFEVKPFSNNQVQLFVQNWYLANEIMGSQKDDRSVRIQAGEGATDLLKRIRNNPNLITLAVNPLLLTMIATVHRFHSSLPGRRVELYAEICEVFLGKRQEAKGLQLELTPLQCQRILQPLAWDMMIRQQREISLAEALPLIAEPLARISPQTKAEHFFKSIEEGSGLLLEKETGVYTFAHLTFQEFLAAMHAQAQQFEGELARRVAEPWWHETIRLYAARADATAIIQACLTGEPPTVPALILALECSKEGGEITPQVRQQLDHVISYGVEEEGRWQFVAKAMLGLRLRHLINVDEAVLVDPSFISHAEYQLFLNEQQILGHYCQPDHWQHIHFLPVQATKPVAGVRPEDAIAFCDWLTKQEGDPHWRYRLPEPGELENYGLGQAADVSHQTNIGYWTASARDITCEMAFGQIPSLSLNAIEQYLNKDFKRTSDNFCSGIEPDPALHLDLIRGFDIEGSITRTLDLDLARDLELAVDSALDLNFDYVLTLALVLDEIHKLDFASHLQIVQALAVNLDYVRSYTGTPDFSLAIHIIRALSHTLDYTYDLALSLDFANLRAVDRNVVHALYLDICYALDIVHSLDNPNADALAYDLDLIRARTLNFVNAFDIELDPDRTLYLDLDYALTVVRACMNTTLTWLVYAGIYGIIQRVPPQVGKIAHLRHSLFQLVLRLSNNQLETHDTTSWRRQERNRTLNLKEQIDQLLNTGFELYLDLVILEERIKGNLPAFEGIRLVKERRKQTK